MQHFKHRVAHKGFKLWQVVIAFIAGAAIVSAAYFAPTFGRKGYIGDDIVDCGNDEMCVINAKLDALLHYFGLYSNAYGAFTSFTGQWTPFSGYWSTYTGSWSDFTAHFTGDWSAFTGDWSNMTGDFSEYSDENVEEDEVAGEFLGYDDYEEEEEEAEVDIEPVPVPEEEEPDPFGKIPRGGEPIPYPYQFRFDF